MGIGFMQFFFSFSPHCIIFYGNTYRLLSSKTIVEVDVHGHNYIQTEARTTIHHGWDDAAASMTAAA